MSLSTRCQCGHTPSRRPSGIANGRGKTYAFCMCDCHAGASQHPAYGPTPVQRQPSKATGQLCPLVIRRAS